MRTFQLFGQNISYSLSPAIHTAALRFLGLDHEYVVTEATAATLPGLIAELRRAGDQADQPAGGANITVPFKALAAAQCDELSDDARAMNACNTIVVEDDRLIGHNTDLPAVAEEIDLLRPSGVSHAVVLGNGGAAQAVQHALARRGATVTVAQRRDDTLATIGPALKDADLLVNATPVGTQSADLPVAAEFLHAGLAVLDLVYRPTPTALVRAAHDAGALARSGGGMLVGQAWRSLALWLTMDETSISPAVVEIMTAELTAQLGGTDD